MPTRMPGWYSWNSAAKLGARMAAVLPADASS